MNSAVPRYRAAALGSLDEFLGRASGLQRSARLPFHADAWLRAWFETLGTSEGRQPLWLVVQRQTLAGNAWVDAMLLPLVTRRRHGLREIGFADAGVVDYVVPLTAADWHGGAHEAPAARALWGALAAALGRHDYWSVEKMLPAALPESGGTSNPLALAWSTRTSEMFGNQFEVDGPWEAWRRGLDKRVRKEIERCWRVFERSPVARFERVTDLQQALALFETLESQQSERMHGLPHYRLDRPAYRAFYRQLLAGGLAEGSVVLTACVTVTTSCRRCSAWPTAHATSLCARAWGVTPGKPARQAGCSTKARRATCTVKASGRSISAWATTFTRRRSA